MRYSDFNITYYKSSNKKMPTNQRLTDYVHEINNLAFQLNNAYTIKGKTARIGKALSKIGIELADVNVIDKFNSKKREILQYLRNTILQLRNAYRAQNDVNECQKTLNYNLSTAIKFKNEQHTSHEILQKILDLKQLKTDLGDAYQKLNTIQFEKIVGELIEKLNIELES